MFNIQNINRQGHYSSNKNVSFILTETKCTKSSAKFKGTMTVKWVLTRYFFSGLSPLRVLEPKPPQQTLFHQHPEAAAGHRAVVHVSDASGVFSLLTGRLEGGDPADVRRAQSQREGEKSESSDRERWGLDFYQDTHLWTERMQKTAVLQRWLKY